MNFKERRDMFFNELGVHKKFVLATSENNRTTARMMSCVVIDNKIYFQTDSTFLKFKQIQENPFVALCIDNIQIEGIAKIEGHPLEDNNSMFGRLYQIHYKTSYEKYSHMKDEIVIAVTPTLITLWCYENGKPYRDFIDFGNETAKREYYDLKV